MFRSGYRLPFRLLGIPLHLDPTFLFVLPLFAWLIGSRIDLYIRLLRLPVDPQALQQGSTPFVLGLLAALGLFASVVLHELGHAVVGLRYGARVKRITLWLLGGVAQFEEIPRQRGAEAVIAIAGPVTSIALAGVCLALRGLLPLDLHAAQFVVGYLAVTNVALAVFNMLPALPLDGGRVLRALLALRMPYLRATQIAARASAFLALLLALYGFLSLNFFLMLIALFVYMAGTAETQQTLVAEMLEGIGVRDLMTRNVVTVSPDMRLGDLIAKMLQERHLGYPVVDAGGRLVGMVDLADIQGLGAEVPVNQVMTLEVTTIPERASALEAFQMMSRNNFRRLVVVGAGRDMVGIISKTDLVRAVQVRVVGQTLTA
ncbi:MAG: site-2 protease family protein [Armatimonadota bacterium]|nr:site-2 protease family protein [Armatimonadota bacterium]